MRSQNGKGWAPRSLGFAPVDACGWPRSGVSPWREETDRPRTSARDWGVIQGSNLYKGRVMWSKRRGVRARHHRHCKFRSASRAGPVALKTSSNAQVGSCHIRHTPRLALSQRWKARRPADRVAVRARTATRWGELFALSIPSTPILRSAPTCLVPSRPAYSDLAPCHLVRPFDPHTPVCLLLRRLPSHL